MLTVHIHLQSLINQILFAVHDIGDVTERFRIMGCGIHMNMNATLLPCHGSCMTELPYKFLNDRDIRILTDGGYEFYFVLIPRRSSILSSCHNTGIIHDLPLSSLIVIGTVFLVVTAIILMTVSQIFSDDLCCFLPRQPGQFNLNPEFLLPHVHN